MFKTLLQEFTEKKKNSKNESTKKNGVNFMLNEKTKPILPCPIRDFPSSLLIFIIFEDFNIFQH